MNSDAFVGLLRKTDRPMDNIKYIINYDIKPTNINKI